jgi:formate hydrogenlyase subunit 3/multisubunit Na+/H+ antiporter MnhD subunit
MEENIAPPPSISSEVQSSLSSDETRQQRQILIWIVIAIVIFLALLVVGVWFLSQNAGRTENIRDIFIILMALESLFIGFVLIILIIQMARLINLLQNEIKPIIESTNETANTLRGTTIFLSEHLTEPVIKLNEYLASFQRLAEIFKITRGKK